MAKITAVVQVDKLVAKLRAMAAKAIKDADVSVVVGYTASYAIFVHERLDLHHKPGKSAKFLEAPLRALANTKVFQQILVAAIAAKKTLAQGLLLCGLRLQRESMMIVPVDTGNLRAGAFTTLERRG